MLPRSYRDERFTEEAKPFRNPSRSPDKIKESKLVKMYIYTLWLLLLP